MWYCNILDNNECTLVGLCIADADMEEIMIRKRLLATLCIAALSVSLTGCGLSSLLGRGGDDADQVTEQPDKPDDDGDQSQKPEKPETDKPDEKPQEEAAGGIKADHTYTYSETVKPYEDYGYEDADVDYSYDIVYTLYANDDGSATMVVEYVYSPDRKYTETCNGTWAEIDGKIEFNYEAHNDYDSSSSYSFEMSGDTVTDVNSFTLDAMVAQAAGTYTCDDPDMGMLELTINREGTATLSMEDGTVYDGYIISEGTRYDFYAYDDDELVIDWYVDCSVNGSFSHAPYGAESMINYDGTYKCTGMLGDLEIVVDGEGNASATIEVDGVKRHFTGHAYAKYTDNGVDYNSIGDVYMSDEEGYSINIELTYMWDETGWNYHGTLTKPLAAG